jgi:hypothetical protein
MSRPLAATGLAALLALAVGAAFAACDNPFALPQATNVMDDTTITLWSMSGTSVQLPSGVDMVDGYLVRTDTTVNFDFAVDMPDSLGDSVPLFLPPGALGLPRDGGLQLSKVLFDSVTSAPTSGYDPGAALKAQAGDVLLVSSRTQTCNYTITYPFYAKLHIISIDPVGRSVTFRMILDRNCGYRSLVDDSLPPSN